MSKAGWLIAGIGVGVLGSLGVGVIRSWAPKYDSTVDLSYQVVRNLGARGLDFAQDPVTKALFVRAAASEQMNLFDWTAVLHLSQTVRSTQELRPMLKRILARPAAAPAAQAPSDPPPPPPEEASAARSRRSDPLT